jgi:hypothetical protein
MDNFLFKGKRTNVQVHSTVIFTSVFRCDLFLSEYIEISKRIAWPTVRGETTKSTSLFYAFTV